jgi:hypothetical protein
MPPSRGKEKRTRSMWLLEQREDAQLDGPSGGGVVHGLAGGPSIRFSQAQLVCVLSDLFAPIHPGCEGLDRIEDRHHVPRAEQVEPVLRSGQLCIDDGVGRCVA